MQLGETVMSWQGKLAKAKAEMATRNVDPWRLPLERVCGKIDYDGIERVTTQMLLDILEVPQRSRRAGTYRHLSKLERFPFRRTISRIREVCSAFRSRDLIKTRGDRLAEAPDGERGILQSICGHFAQERLEFGE